MGRRRKDKLADYYDRWIKVYKENDVRAATYQKWQLSGTWIKRIAGDMILQQMTRADVQQIVNEYGKTHAMLTVKGGR